MMKNSYLILLFISLISCTETQFGNKVMRDIGNGKYTSGLISKGYTLLDNDEVFDFCEIYNLEATKEKRIDNEEDYFMTEVLFNDFQLVETQTLEVDLLGFMMSDTETGPKSKENSEALKKFYRDSDKNYREIGGAAIVYTSYTAVKKHLMKYKISTRQSDRIAYLTVMKLPGKGYRVTSFLVL